MKAALCSLVLVTAATAAAAAQEPPPVPPTAPPVTAPATPPAAPPASPAAGLVPAPQDPPPATTAAAPQPAPFDVEGFRRRRNKLRSMEGLLIGAVRGAAQEIAAEMQTPETGPFVMTGSPTARGFVLDGYGVFFHVEVPGVQPSLFTPISIEALQRFAQRRQQAQPASAGGSEPINRTATSADLEYVERVKLALIDAMIEHGKPLELRPDEWFTVAAGDGDEPLSPVVLAEKALMILRVRGRDIADYAAGRLTLDEVRKRVEVQKF